MEFNILEICLLSALAICFLIHLYYVLGVHLKLAQYRINDLTAESQRPISVIVCARNEKPNLEKYLHRLFEQDYPQFEVVVVNDRSWDGTADLLEELGKKYSNLKVVQVAEGNKFIAGKKFAVTMGIKAASHEWLVFTDADCEPATPNWLKGMQQPADDDIEIVLGYSPYFKRKSLLNVLIRFETFFTAVNYLSFAVKGMPYMGVGRNMAYKKSLFFKNKGFAAHMHILSGDDDLFVNANARPDNSLIQIHRDTHVWSEPKTSFLAYLRQKKRHIGAGKFYKPKHKFILSAQIAVQFLFYALVIALAVLPSTRFIAAGIFLLSLMIRCFVYPKLLKRLNYGELRWWFPILDILLMAFLVFNAMMSVFVKKVQWK
ncbi:glycosyltransferase [Pedobacter nanyangensis]|uniref:glycosyltransferase n=1 Tax=Pedobacter nanyangensis TaxID=1562389 RepID=UPI001F06B0DE|nr:glycosyltransferase [Pedobacter nanyangensis]